MDLENRLSDHILEALFTSPNLIDRTKSQIETIGPGYWYFQINRPVPTVAYALEFESLYDADDNILNQYLSDHYDIHNIDKWVYLPIEAGNRNIRHAIEESDLSKTIFAATSLHTPDELLTKNIQRRCTFSWRRENVQ